MYTSHSVMEGQRHNNPLNRVAFVYNGPKGMELAPNDRIEILSYICCTSSLMKMNISNGRFNGQLPGQPR